MKQEAVPYRLRCMDVLLNVYKTATARTGCCAAPTAVTPSRARTPHNMEEPVVVTTDFHNLAALAYTAAMLNAAQVKYANKIQPQGG